MIAVQPWRRARAPYDSSMIFFARVVAFLMVLAQIASAQPLDPAGWGDDHVGKAVPNFTSGDECLFCHRDVGPGWPTNRHGQTVRAVEADSPLFKGLSSSPLLRGVANQVEFVLGGKASRRFMKRSVEHGRLDLLDENAARWDAQTFGARCAGCHASGVDSGKQTFTAVSLDCFVCHGDVPDQHTTQGSLAVLSPKRKESAAVVTSICAQCHLRGGVSKSSGLPYANHFVAGDNLFRDFRIDLAAAATEKLNPGDRHVHENVRDVVVNGREGVTCLSCHNIHQQSAKKHHTVANGAICLNCHTAESKKVRVSYEVHSKTCDY
jgi:predicted CXXCH cytochrome family protein